MAQEKSLEAVFHDYEIDLLDAVPAARVSSEEFRTRRWPQLLTLTDVPGRIAVAEVIGLVVPH